MNRSLNTKKKQHTAAGAKRSVSLLSSEEELSDRRSSSSIESAESHKESKCQRSTRKAAKKGWQEKFEPFDCQFVVSSTSDEEWNEMVPKHSSDSDIDWNPEKSQCRSTASLKPTPIAMKRTSSGSPPILKPESNLKASDEDQHSPPKLMAIVNKSKDCPKPSRPPQLKAKPASDINYKDKILLSVQTPPNCLESTSGPEMPCPPILEAKPIFEMIKEKNLSVVNCKPPKLKVKSTQIQKDCNNQLKPNQPLSNILMEPVSPNNREKVTVAVTSPGPPKLSPIFEKPQKKSQVDCFASPLKETSSLLLAEDDVSEASLEPPKLSIFKKKKRGSHKSSKPPILEEVVPVSWVIEEDQVSTPSPGPPNLTSTLTKSKICYKKSSQSPLLEAAISNIVVPEKDQQISVPSTAALKFVTSDKKSKKRSPRRSRPPVLEETTFISKVSEVQESIPSLTRLKSESVSNKKVKRTSLKSSQPSTLEDLVTIPPTTILPEAQASSTSLPTPSKTISIVKKKSSSPKSSPIPTVIPESTSDGVQSSTTPSPQLSIDCSLSFTGMISHKANLLEKGFESGKFIMLKSDLKTQKSPSIWRIDGKNLLQKYESISYNEGIAYRNISTYSSWMASNKGLYVPIEVEFSVQSKSETIVTFDRKKVMLPIEDGMMEALNEEANSMIDTFQIYLQTLISQALDSNFVKEIVKEQDEYFLSSIAAVEDHWILPKRNMLKEIIKMKKPFQELLETHPGLELRCVTSGDKSCDSCNGRNPTRSFEFQTLSYSFDTLDIMEGKPSNKMYRLCLSCTDRILLYHELFHMRYHLFTCCKTKVNQYDQGDGPAALTSSLADQNWKSLMHRKVLLVLAETQQVISQYSADACVV